MTTSLSRNSKLIGGILLIVGTSLGGGMLALSTYITAEVGFTNSIFFLAGCWLVMTLGALLILEVNLRLPRKQHRFYGQSHFGPTSGQIVAWITYLLLFYTLLAAYISGGSDIFQSLLQGAHLHVPTWLTALFS